MPMFRLLIPRPLAASLPHRTTASLGDGGAAARAATATLTVEPLFATGGPSGAATRASGPSNASGTYPTHGRLPFGVSYLVKSCGLTPAAAATATKRVRIDGSEQPDAVLALLRDHGFTKTHVSRLVTKWPPLLLVDPEADLKPKLEFFRRLGFSTIALPNFVCNHYGILNFDLQNKIMPAVRLLRAAVGTDEGLVTALSRNPTLLSGDISSRLSPKIKVLKWHGVPDSRISQLMVLFPRTMTHRTDRLRRAVKKVSEMGINPSFVNFIKSVAVLCGMARSTWGKKLAFYRSLCWSREDVLWAFCKHPSFMTSSEEKIRRITGLLGDAFNWGPAYLSAHAKLLNLSFEKRIFPRASVLQVLRSRGLLNRKVRANAFTMTDKAFSDLYVVKYEEDVPEVLEAYRGKMKPQLPLDRKKWMELKQLSE